MESTIDEVNIKINSESKDVSQGLDALAKSIGGLTDSLKVGMKGLEKYSASLLKLQSAQKKANKSSKGSKGKGGIFSKLPVLKVGALLYGIQKVGSAVMGAVGKTNSYIESMNMFTVSMGEMTDKSLEFVDSFSKVLGLNPANVMKYMGTFNDLITGFGISSDKAYIMSKNLTQLSYDLSSFKDIKIDQAMQKLKSGIAGEIEPMRAIGIALDQATLQETAHTLGIKKKVSEMTRAQKTELLYYQIMTRTAHIQKDMARKILTPANALRVLKEQFTSLAIAVGKIFIPMMMAVIPYVMVLTKWLTALANTIAGFFGFKMPDIDNKNIKKNLGGISSGIGDIGGSAKKANKELNLMLGKFDELNVIEFDKDKGGGGGSGSDIGAGGSLGIELPNYDVLTSELEARMKETEEKFKRLLPIIEAIGAAFLTWKVSRSITKLLASIGKITKGQALGISFGITLAVSGIVLLYNGMKKILNGEVNLYSILEAIGGGAMSTFGIATLLKATGMTKVKSLQVGFGLTIAITGLQIAIHGLKEAVENGINVPIMAEITLGIAGIVAGIALMIGNIPVAIGAGIAAAIAAIVLIISKNWESISNFFTKTIPEKWNKFVKWLGDKWEDFKKWLGELPYKIGKLLGNIAAEVVIFFTKTIPEEWDKFDKWADQKWEDFKTWLGEIPEHLKTFFTVTIPEKWNQFVEWLNKIPGKLKEIGKNIIQGLWDGVKEKWREFKQGVKDFIQGFIDGFKEKLGIHSPSTVMFDIGGNIVDGLINGISQLGNKLNDWWNNTVKPWFSWDKWKNLGQDAVNAIQNSFSGANFHIKKPHFSWGMEPAYGWVGETLKALNLPAQTPKLRINWYADGGMPKAGELFVAGEAGPEVVSQIGNKSAVANTQQMTTAMEEASYRGVSRAMQENNGRNKQPVNVYVGNRKLYSGFGQQLDSDNNMYGTSVVQV